MFHNNLWSSDSEYTETLENVNTHVFQNGLSHDSVILGGRGCGWFLPVCGNTCPRYLSSSGSVQFSPLSPDIPQIPCTERHEYLTLYMCCITYVNFSLFLMAPFTIVQMITHLITPLSMHKCMFSNCTHLMHFIFNIFIIIIHVVIPFKIFLWQLKQLFNKINKS